MEFENENFSLKVDLKYITIMLLIIQISFLIYTESLKEPSNIGMIGSIIELILNK